MRVLHTISSISRATGGPSRSVTALCNHLGMTSSNIDLLTIGHELEHTEWVLPIPSLVTLHSSVGWRIPPMRVRFCPRFGKRIVQLDKDGEKLSVIHDHGLWLPSNYASAKASKALGIPLIVSARGMLEPWALNYHGWKKKLVWRAWQKGALDRAAVLHATASEEADNLRALGLQNPIAVIPNGVDLPELPDGKKSDVKIALFLSRIHPKKGLMNLVEAWAKVKPHGWRMVIAGPSEASHDAEVKRAAENAGLVDQFEFSGPVDDLRKWDLYQQADIFVLPTFSENFGIVVAEALAAEVPVITTKGTPWRELENQRCGWWVDIGADSLAVALKEAMALNDDERFEMGRRGRALIKERYSWKKIASDMLGVYEWVLGGGTRPACVRLD